MCACMHACGWRGRGFVEDGEKQGVVCTCLVMLSDRINCDFQRLFNGSLVIRVARTASPFRRIRSR